MKKIFIILLCLLISSPAFAFNKFMVKLQKKFKNSELVTIQSYRAFDFYAIQEGWHKESPSEFDALIIYPKGEGPFPSSKVTAGSEMIGKWKVITSYVGYDHGGNPGKDGKRKVFSKVEILSPGTICNETYLVIGNYDTEVEAKNLQGYMKTKFLTFFFSISVNPRSFTL